MCLKQLEHLTFPHLSRRAFASLCILVLMTSVTAGCMDPHHYSSDPIHATVVDSQTRVPIAGAEVLVQWKVEWPTELMGHTSGSEMIEQRAVTNRDGSFDVPGWATRWVRGRVYVIYPTVTVTRQGNVQTVHRNQSSTFGDGTLCNDQFTRNIQEMWHGSGAINVTWNNCVLDSYADETTKQGAIRFARLRYYAAFTKARSSTYKSRYTWLFGDFISAKNIAQTEPESQFVRDTFCAPLTQTYEHLTQVERTDLLEVNGGYPPVAHDHAKYVVPYCSPPANAQQAVAADNPHAARSTRR